MQKLPLLGYFVYITRSWWDPFCQEISWCPTGWTYDGEICEEQNDVTCSNGKALVDGKCVCPTGSAENSDGVCEPQKCTSGLETGKK